MFVRFARQVACLLLTVFLATACGSGGGSDAPEIPDRQAFDKAVASYLDRQSMDLAIREYRSFEMADDESTATAVISMGHADEAYGSVAVRFQFNFQKTGDRWQVVSHQKVKK